MAKNENVLEEIKQGLEGVSDRLGRMEDSGELSGYEREMIVLEMLKVKALAAIGGSFLYAGVEREALEVCESELLVDPLPIRMGFATERIEAGQMVQMEWPEDDWGRVSPVKIPNDGGTITKAVS